MDIKKYEPLWESWYIKDFIGEGSFGKVYVIERTEFDFTYKAALKHIKIPQSQSEIKGLITDGMTKDEIRDYYRNFVKDLVKEYELMSRLKGDSHIVSYEDHKYIENKEEISWDIFIRMELLTPLYDYIMSIDADRRTIIRLGIDICKALELCQKYNIIHRDIKPENIFVSENGYFKLGDFGIARTMESTVSNMSKKGTYTYIAPEVYKGESYGSSVDIYSLGIVMYRLLNNNRAPFMPPYPEPISHTDRENALLKRLSGAPIPPPANAEGRLGEIVFKACAYDPKDRYSSPSQMRAELEAIMYNEAESKIIYPDGDSSPVPSAGYLSTEDKEEETKALSEVQPQETQVPETQVSETQVQETQVSETPVSKVQVQKPQVNKAQVQETRVSEEKFSYSEVSRTEGFDETRTMGFEAPKDINKSEADKITADKPDADNVDTDKSEIDIKASEAEKEYKNNKKIGYIAFAVIVLALVSVFGIYQTDKNAKERAAEEARIAEEERVAEEARRIFEEKTSKLKATREKLANQPYSIEKNIGMGVAHLAILKTDGTVVVTGSNKYGQCNVSDWSDITEISAGYCHTVGLKSDGTVVATGDNGNGQNNVSNWSDIVEISTGVVYTVGLKSDGTVIATGDNDRRQCDVSDWSGIVKISTGDYHTLGLKSDGTVIATGDNYYGQCEVSDWSDIVGISTGNAHTAGLKSDGTVVATGYNRSEECYVSDWSDIVEISTGSFFTLGLDTNGKVYCTKSEIADKLNTLDNIVSIYSEGDISIAVNDQGQIVYYVPDSFSTDTSVLNQIKTTR